MLRQVNEPYRRHYEALMGSGLYDRLVAERLLVRHREAELDLAAEPGAAFVLQPDEVPFVSYPYEWCCQQIKDAALATLAAARIALDHGMVLKDASAYNVQFVGGRATLIDTLSFETWQEGTPWVAYGQFCRHFLAPLALATRVDPRLVLLLRTHLDGIPLDLAAKMLPRPSRWNIGLWTHLVLHGKAATTNPSRVATARGSFSKNALYGLLDSLQATVLRLNHRASRTTWSNYYDDTNYSNQAMDAKATLVEAMLRAVEPSPLTVWDLGANTGRFSGIAAGMGASTIAWDFDHGAVERHWIALKKAGDARCLPLVLDLTNPSPALGWAHSERASLLERGPADVALALALLHHVAIGNNVPLGWVAEFMAQCARRLVIEFVPKEDSQVSRMLSTREDVFDDYCEGGFLEAFSQRFDVVQQALIPGTKRVLYLMKRRGP